ncbi:ATP-binding protein [Pectinatus frisingensis]|uniref:ATP-binding protein n=1 Tax=Pectinatus frisingensis TaxID=865 RepID=UPI0018C482A5|nr:ATP-binding protein [Pectinatus frisingensis]
MMTPLAMADALRIGNVDFVSPDEIKVIIDIEAPNDVALNAGTPRPFPRINSYVLIPSESGFLVAQIEWITIERSQYPKRKGLQDFGLIDLPFPLRKMSLNPLGVLHENVGKPEKPPYTFSRGVEVFPTVGDPVLLPSQIELKAIVESGDNRRVKIGVSPLAGNAEVRVDPDRLFGRHLAILGNTGSGKSCSVAGVIRWSIEAAKREMACPECGQLRKINSRFIILDPNGEYSRAFKDMDNVRVFSVEADSKNKVEQLQVPLWLWNSSEWCAFTQASSRAQRPVLIQALRTVRDGTLDIALTPSTYMRRYLRTLVDIIRIELANGEPWAAGQKNFGKRKGFYDGLIAWRTGTTEDVSFTQAEKDALSDLNIKLDSMIDAHTQKPHPSYLFDQATIIKLMELTSKAHSTFGGSDRDILPIDADIPRPFTGDLFLRSIQSNAELLKSTEYVETMLTRIRTLLSDSRMKVITNCSPDLTLQKWLEMYICPTNSSDGSITVIDLSLVPAEVIHIVTAVIARMTLEALQRYRHLNGGKTLPTTLVMEEAHTFIRKYANDAEETCAYSMCTRVFEKIAREGRKFGLGLVLSSQRPSELSQTVLSQCNTFLLHRISNARDQDLVNRLVPDNLRGLLRELPSLPSQKAILLGWASELPVLVQMNYLEEDHRPKSDDPEYWKTWTDIEKNARTVNWGTIADIWQEKETDVDEVQGIDEEAKEQIKKDDSDYGDYLCHVEKDRQAMSSANTDSETDDEELPF